MVIHSMMPIHPMCLEDHVDTFMTVQILQQFRMASRSMGYYISNHNAFIAQSLYNAMFRVHRNGPCYRCE